MQLRCPHCQQVLEFATRQPRYCYVCGKPLAIDGLEPTVRYEARHLDAEATRPYCLESCQPAAAAPESVGGYRLLRAIGSGGMGTVYEAEETSTRRRVALKLIRHEFATSQDALERFRREGRLAGTITHPRCVFVLAADEEAGRPYIVMELMPGETLADLVARRGPLPASEAVTLILDVIEGLQEAHRCGLVHRDVKPSNCFLDAEGRVKIGDFGLAKSLVQRGALTQSGSFLGTVLFAAPEQIKNDKVDRQADVYSAAATLYFLLTGRAPFESGDAAATLARTLSDPLTPMCQLRPGLPRTLDDVALRGLARARDRRWPDLESFRLALLPFVPGTHAAGQVGWRFAAYLVDNFVVTLVEFALLWGLMALLAWSHVGIAAAGLVVCAALFSLATNLVWYAAPEKVWGCSPGKYLFKLQVRGVRSDDRPAWEASIGRTLWSWLLKDGPARPLVGMLLLYLAARLPMPITLLVLAISELGRLSLITATMRRKNGFRGLHEFLSGTKVIRLPTREAEHFLNGPADGPPPPAAAGLPERLGAFTVRAALRSGPEDDVLLGVDEVLDRQVWLWVRPAAGDSFQSRRREVNRTTRPRWLAGGQEGDRVWDAFVASPGWLLPDLVRTRGRQFWPQVRPILEQLAEELSRCCEEGTLPPALGVDQIWVQATGRVQLLDTPLRDHHKHDRAGRPTPGADDQRCALALLYGAAALLLEGKPRSPGLPPARFRAPVPKYASEFLGRLAGVSRPFGKVQDFQAELRAVRDRSATVTRTRRVFALLLQGAALSLGVGFMLLLSLALVQFAMVGAFLFPDALGRVALEDLNDEIARGEEMLAATHDPAVADQLEQNRLTRTRLRDDLDYVHDRHEAALASSSWFVRDVIDYLEKRLRDALRKQVHALKAPQKIDDNLPEITPHASQNAANVHQMVSEQRGPWGDIGWREAVQGVTVMLVWPVLWAFWGGLTRGGWSLPLAGIVVVQGDGRPAARWRCVVRAALVWVPFVLLLVASFLLDLWRVAATAPAVEMQVTAWLAWLAWWLAVAWLPLHLALSLRWPDRAWHDHLAGTYLVPR
jgi:hypothetical protein